MLVKIEKLGPGLHPSELIVRVTTKSGQEDVAVDRSSVVSDSLFVGWPVGQDDTHYLIELPRPSLSGKWRVWVLKGSVLPGEEPQRRRA